MDPAQLYEAPFTQLAPTGPEALFDEADVDALVAAMATVRANAVPQEEVA